MNVPESALSEYFSECDEILQRFSSNLSKIESKSEVTEEFTETIDALYRDMHTLKGSSQLFGFQSLAQIAHAMEAALEPVRRLKIKIPQKQVDVFFKCIDLIDRILKNIETDKNTVSTQFSEEITALVSKLLSEVSKNFNGEILVHRETFAVSEGNDQFAKNLKQNTLITKTHIEKKESQEKTMDVNTSKEEAQTVTTDTNSTVRIQVGLLDNLMNLVGEMVLIRNQVLQYTQKNDDLAFLNLSQRLDLVTSELQGEVMKTRMQPIGSILGKFQRVVRDLGKELGKQIEFNVLGGETELDKTLLEAIKDPLTHIIRNSCDHGIETTEERKVAGKNPVAHVSVKAFHEGGQVIVEIADDGRGLNFPRILEKALEKKIITADQAKSISEREIANLIFAPGFSTAEKVSAVSGRGVGMDVVKTNLEKVGGQVEIQSRSQKGMIIRLKIPLTLAIVPALIVQVGSEQFAIPQIKLSELVRVENDASNAKIEFLQGKPVFRLRGRLLSLINLADVLKIKSTKKSDSVNIVVLNGEGDTFGLLVDEIRDTADIVVKPLSHFLKRLSAYSGATIMGDGTVSLILDITGLAQKANLVHKNSKNEFSAESALAQKSKTFSSEMQDFLFFKLDSDESYCLPLCLVNRLEEFSTSQIEYSGNERMVKYRGNILPIISLNNFLNIKPQHVDPSKDLVKSVSIIVIQKSGKYFGLEVNDVVDIMSVKGSIEDPLKKRNGILGSIIVDSEVATVVDAHGILDSILGVASVVSTEAQGPVNASVLFAEDTVFFMKQVKKVLEENGMKVTHVPDGEQALKTLNASNQGDFQLLLTDIEMPNLNGFQLAEKIRAESKFKSIPMIALTTKFREVDQKKGKEVGFDFYLEKLKSDELINTIKKLLSSRSEKQV